MAGNDTHEHRHERGDTQEWWKLAAAVAAAVLVVVAIAWYFAEPAPPARVVIASGAADGHYYRTATRYAEFFADSGIELVVRETAGSVENLDLLADPNSGVDAAIVQGGLVSHDTPGLEAVVSIGPEPVWVFYRSEQAWTRLTDLAGSRIAIGAPGSGVQALARQLLSDNGVEPGEATRFAEIGGAAAVAALRDRSVDAAVFVTAPSTSFIRDLLALDGVKLMTFEQAEAYGRRFTFLSPVTIHQGVVDLATNLPDHDVRTIAPVTALIVRKDTHPAVIQLLVYAARQVHGSGDAMSEPGTFPSLLRTGLPVSDDARYHFERKPGFLQRHLPFWLTSLIDRLVILLIPLAVLLMPLLKFMPPVYRWQIRSRIYRWYKRLRGIDSRLRDQPTFEQAQHDREDLMQLDREITHVRVPLSYMQEFYNLRLHVDFLRARIDAYLEQVKK